MFSSSSMSSSAPSVARPRLPPFLLISVVLDLFVCVSFQNFVFVWCFWIFTTSRSPFFPVISSYSSSSSSSSPFSLSLTFLRLSSLRFRCFPYHPPVLLLTRRRSEVPRRKASSFSRWNGEKKTETEEEREEKNVNLPPNNRKIRKIQSTRISTTIPHLPQHLGRRRSSLVGSSSSSRMFPTFDAVKELSEVLSERSRRRRTYDLDERNGRHRIVPKRITQRQKVEEEKGKKNDGKRDEGRRKEEEEEGSFIPSTSRYGECIDFSSLPFLVPSAPPLFSDNSYLSASSASSSNSFSSSSSSYLDSSSDAFSSSSSPFASLGLRNPTILRNIHEGRIQFPTVPQQHFLPLLLSPSKPNVLLIAPTGSGKTLCFLLPTLDRLNPSLPFIQLLVVSPSRELAAQTFHVCRSLLVGTNITTVLLIGGANPQYQRESLKKQIPHVVIATPGRLQTFLKDIRMRKRMNTYRCRYVILDEADHLLDSQSDSDCRSQVDELIKRHLPPPEKRQMIFASATGDQNEAFLKAVREYCGSKGWEFGGGIEQKRKLEKEKDQMAGDNEERREAAEMGSRSSSGGSERKGEKESEGLGKGLPSNLLHVRIMCVHNNAKLETLRKLYNAEPFPKRILCFCNTPGAVDWAVKWLRSYISPSPSADTKTKGANSSTRGGRRHLEVIGVSGRLSKEERTEALLKLRRGLIGIAVATEVAARGLDFPLMTHIVNLDLPTDSEHYLHRAGRVGRAGNPGIVASLYTPSQEFIIKKFEREVGVDIKSVEMYNGKMWKLLEDTEDEDVKEEHWRREEKRPQEEIYRE